jgi:hypothetical protein
VSAGDVHRALRAVSWLTNQRLLWEPIDPSPMIDQAINGGYSWLQIECSRCNTARDVDLATVAHPSTTFVHDLSAACAAGSARKPGSAQPPPCCS